MKHVLRALIALMLLVPLVSVFIPPIPGHSEMRRRAASGVTLKLMHNGITTWAGSHGGKYPDDWGVLVKAGLVELEQCSFPDHEPRISDEIRNDPDRLARLVAEHSDYVYLRAGWLMKQCGKRKRPPSIFG